MANYLIGYDLNKADKDYPSLYEVIKEQSDGSWWHELDSTWIIRSNRNALQIYEAIEEVVDSNDTVLVVSLSRAAAWTGFSQSGSDWLQKVL